jgi:hypothetical protein
MIIPSSTHGVIASSRPRVVVASGDVTPNAVNFTSIYYNNDVIEYGYTEKQITGINQTITLKVQYNSPGSTVYYSVSNSSGFAVFGDNNSPNSPLDYGMTAISNNGTFTVSNNQYVTFGVTPVCSVSAIVTVLNQSDGDAVLDTFFIEHYGECF